VSELPRNLACLTNEAISIIRCQSGFAYVPQANRDAVGRKARRVSLAVSAPAAKGADPPGLDAHLAFTWDGRGAGAESLALREAVRPVCSPESAARNAAILDRSVGGWGSLTLLDAPAPERKWASWQDWFELAGRPDAPPRMLEFDTYGEVLLAAAAGQGIALGWRHWIEHYVEAGVLVPLGSEWVERDNFYYGLLTEKGLRRPLARDCLAFMARSIQD